MSAHKCSNCNRNCHKCHACKRSVFCGECGRCDRCGERSQRPVPCAVCVEAFGDLKAKLAAHEAALADTPENVEAVARELLAAGEEHKSLNMRLGWENAAAFHDLFRHMARAVLSALRLRAAPTNPQPQERP